METIIKNKNQVPKFSTEQIYVNNDETKYNEVYDKVDKTIEQLQLSKKDSLHMKLLFEESIGMVKAITGDFTAIVWVEEYEGESWLRLVGKTNMDIDKKTDLISVSSSGENALAVGFMGKIRDFVETGLLNYDGVMKLQQKYSGYGMGISGSYLDTAIASNPHAFTGFMWTMDDYKKSLKEGNGEPETTAYWDELEKSIVASIAKDVVVGVEKNQIEMAFIMEI
ncbi:hypothetical protein SAMN04487831_10654 [Pseudobutyrivibrio sp. UC1225]|uniref:hypothetical protein n=1 Tax=Pseudobutyrivibrio sp. UC1225 TaxID=1798185 RepID=UPI0008E3092B|nr:hypothetical protein [Pseudobutyrivibrio sp. UC1225]SFO01975.1 hypothetical protein SAMN04487831_10654 [Pseudobutyrivibrio sp. UC1225]